MTTTMVRTAGGVAAGIAMMALGPVTGTAQAATTAERLCGPGYSQTRSWPVKAYKTNRLLGRVYLATKRNTWCSYTYLHGSIRSAEMDARMVRHDRGNAFTGRKVASDAGTFSTYAGPVKIRKPDGRKAVLVSGYISLKRADGTTTWGTGSRTF